MSTDAPPQYTIRLYDRYEMVCEFQVSQYRYGRRELYELMRAIFVSRIVDSPEGFASFYVNKRKGNPPWDTRLDLSPIHSEEEREIGQIPGTSQLFVTATQSVSPTTFDFLLRRWKENKTTEFEGESNEP